MSVIEQLFSKLNPGKNTPLVMGILNVTPDSFSDGDKYNTFTLAVEQAFELIRQGADIIDIGGESSRPGSFEVSAEQELARVIPVIKEIRKNSDLPISIDTRKAIVAELAIEAGATIVNDISSLCFDKDMVKVLAKYPQVSIILMHMQGEPATMQKHPHYDDIIKEITSFFEERIAFCDKHQISKDRIMLDPGIGFGKSLQHNLTILAELKSFKDMGYPVILGASRKAFINLLDVSEPLDRIGGSLATTALAIEAAIDIVRVHDVKEHAQFIKVMNSVKALRMQK